MKPNPLLDNQLEIKKLLHAPSVVACILFLTAASAFSQYSITELPPLGGGNLAQRINDKGQIVGESLFDGPPHAALWYQGAVIDLGTLGGEVSIANDINNRGQITGFSQIASGATRAFLWENGVMANIGTLGTAATFAFGINQNTEIAGYSRVGGAGTPFHAFKWHNGVFTDLGTLGGTESFAYDINDQGCVVGESEIDPDIPGLTHAFVWCDGVMTDLGTLGGPVSAANGINENGEIVGMAMTADFEFHAFSYEKGVMTDLGVLPEGHFSGAVGINARGQIVGINSPDPENGLPRKAVLWYKSMAGELPLLFGSQEGFANDVNALGVIVGMSTDSLGRRHAVVWTSR